MKNGPCPLFSSRGATAFLATTLTGKPRGTNCPPAQQAFSLVHRGPPKLLRPAPSMAARWPAGKPPGQVRLATIEGGFFFVEKRVAQQNHGELAKQVRRLLPGAFGQAANSIQDWSETIPFGEK